MVMPLAVAEAAAVTLDSNISSALTSSFSSIATNAMSVISASLPYALTIIGSVLAVTIGIKVFKKIAGKA